MLKEHSSIYRAGSIYRVLGDRSRQGGIISVGLRWTGSGATGGGLLKVSPECIICDRPHKPDLVLGVIQIHHAVGSRHHVIENDLPGVISVYKVFAIHAQFCPLIFDGTFSVSVEAKVSCALI